MIVYSRRDEIMKSVISRCSIVGQALKNTSEKEKGKSRNTSQKRAEGALSMIESGGDADGEEGVGETSGGANDDEELSGRLNAFLAMTHQKQLEHCLRFRSFASRNYVSKMRLLREFNVFVRWMVGIGPLLEQRLCGDQSHALSKIRLMLGRQLMMKLDRECISWQALQVEQQLVEDALREDEKRRRKDQKRQAAKNAVKQKEEAAAAAASSVKAEGNEEGSRTESKLEEVRRPSTVDAEPSWQVAEVREEDESMDGWTVVAERDTSSGWGRSSSNRRRQQENRRGHRPSGREKETTNASAQPPQVPSSLSSSQSQNANQVPPSSSLSSSSSSPLPRPEPLVQDSTVSVADAGADTFSQELIPTASSAKDDSINHHRIDVGTDTGGGGPQESSGEECMAAAGPGSEDRMQNGNSPQPSKGAEMQSRSIHEEEEDVPIVFGVADEGAECHASDDGDEEEDENIQFGFVVEVDGDEEEMVPPESESAASEAVQEEDQSSSSTFDSKEAGHLTIITDGDGGDQGTEPGEFSVCEESVEMEPSTMLPLHGNSSTVARVEDREDFHFQPESPLSSLPLQQQQPAGDADRDAMSGSPMAPPPHYMTAPPFYFLPTGPNGGAAPAFDAMVPPFVPPPPPPHGYANVYGQARGAFLGAPGHNMEVPPTPPGPMYHPQQLPPALARGPMPFVDQPNSGAGVGKYKGQGMGMRNRDGWGRGGPNFNPHHNNHHRHGHSLNHHSQQYRGPRGPGVGYGSLDLQARPPQPMAVHMIPQASTPGGSTSRTAPSPLPRQQQQQPPQQQPHFGYPPPPYYHPSVSPSPNGVSPHPHSEGPLPSNAFVPFEPNMMYSPRGAIPPMMSPPSQQCGFSSRSPEKIIPQPQPRQRQVEVRIDVHPNQGLNQAPRSVNGNGMSPETEEEVIRRREDEDEDGMKAPEVSIGAFSEYPESSGAEQEQDHSREMDDVMLSPVFGSVLEIEHSDLDNSEVPPSPPAEVQVSDSNGPMAMASPVVETKPPVTTAPETQSNLPAVSSASPAAVGTSAAGGIAVKGQRRSKGSYGDQRSDNESLPVGLSNKVGQNHCFLNVVVQCLWNLDSFREGFCTSQPIGMETTAAPGTNVSGAAVVDHALRSIFRGMADLGSPEAAAEKPNVSVDYLRQALSDIAGENSRFRLGHMDDAVEAFEEILGYLLQGKQFASCLGSFASWRMNHL